MSTAERPDADFQIQTGHFSDFGIDYFIQISNFIELLSLLFLTTLTSTVAQVPDF